MTKVSKSRRSKHQIMANGGQWSPVVVVQEGEKKLDWVGLCTTTVEDAFKLYSKGLAVTTA